MDLFLVYLICFGVGLLFTVVSAIMSHGFGHDAGGHDAGGGTDGHAEAGFGSHDMPQFAALSPTTIAAFITAFGGFGIIFHRIEATSNPWINAPLSLLGGFAISALLVWMFRVVFRRTQGSSEGRVAALIGCPATVITPIGASGVGEIAYVQSGTRYTAPARAEDNAVFANGATVKITRIIGTQFYVTAA